MISFPFHDTCDLCDLHEQCKTVGIPTRPAGLDIEGLREHEFWGQVDFSGSRGESKAVLFIGEAPGFHEDEAGHSWVGFAGQLLHRWIAEAWNLPAYADSYLTNACRCRPPANETPKNRHQNACRPYLLADIEAVLDVYGPSNTFLVAMGAVATNTLLKTSIKAALLYQGQPLIPRDASWDTPVRTFYTYHPARCAPKRSPETVHAIDAHMRLLVSALRDEAVPVNDLPPIEYAPRTFGDIHDNLLCIDVETYGILRGQPEQTVFHPQKMKEVDGVPLNKQTICCSAAWIDPSGTRHVAWYNLWDRTQRDTLLSALKQLPIGTTLIGMNITFDMLCLRALPFFNHLLIERNFRLDDLAIVNHLHADSRPEKSYKSLAQLFGIADYTALTVSMLPTGVRASSPTDPNLIHYSCLDAHGELSLYLKLRADLWDRWSESYAPVDRSQFRSDILWTILSHSEAGIPFDTAALSESRKALSKQSGTAIQRCSDLGYTITGKGSVASVRQLVMDCVEAANIAGDRRLEFTEKHHYLSTSRTNIQLLLGTVPTDHPVRPALDAFNDHKKVAGILSSYLIPLLTKPDKGCLSTGTAYPSWFPVPAYVKDDSGSEKGTRQCRFAATQPAAQTFPPPVYAAQRSRYKDGYLFAYDMSQNELRVAALLSGDPEMLRVFSDPSIDPHHEALLHVWPGTPRDRGNPSYEEKRDLGKRANFLVIYRGGPGILVQTVRKFTGREISPHLARTVIDALWEHRQGLHDYQDTLIADVVRDGHLELITGWRRTFIRSAYLVESTYINEICNVYPQGYGAQVVQSAQTEIRLQCHAARLTFSMPAQCHDSILVDAPSRDMHAVDSIVRSVLLHPPLWETLCETTGNRIPLAFDVKILDTPTGVHP